MLRLLSLHQDAKFLSIYKQVLNLGIKYPSYCCSPIYMLLIMELGQVLLSVVCILVAPKRKVAGRLEVMRSSLHFYGEFVVEGTGGQSVFTRSGGLNYPDGISTETPEKGSLKPKINFREKSSTEGGDFEKGNAMERLDPMQQCTTHGGPSKDVKRHRRWDLSQVRGSFTVYKSG